jgi:type VI secretion system protein ImpH
VTGGKLADGRLKDDVGAWAFFQLVLGLERESDARAAPVGGTGPAAAEAIRFRGVASLAFPPGDIAEIDAVPVVTERREDTGIYLPEERIRLACTFLGLYGPSSPLPAGYTERILWAAADNGRLRDFLDLFNHRLLSLFYRSWGKYRAYAHVRADRRDSYTNRLLAMGGIADAGEHLAAELDPMRLLPFIGLLRMRTRSAHTVSQIVSGYFGGLPVRLEELVMRRVELPDWQRNQLAGMFCTLGVDFVLGGPIEDDSGKIRLWVGPLDAERFLEFMPDGKAYKALAALLRLALVDPLEVELVLNLEEAAVPEFRLEPKTEPGSAMLGWSSWVGDGRASDRTVRFTLA